MKVAFFESFICIYVCMYDFYAISRKVREREVISWCGANFHETRSAWRRNDHGCRGSRVAYALRSGCNPSLSRYGRFATFRVK